MNRALFPLCEGKRVKKTFSDPIKKTFSWWLQIIHILSASEALKKLPSLRRKAEKGVPIDPKTVSPPRT
jgi:hypothetical protein